MTRMEIVMGRVENIKAKLLEQKPLLAEKYKVKEIGIFGSFARGEQAEASDIDILVEFSEPISFFTFIDLEDHLSEILGVRVDLVSKKALKPHIGKNILEELVEV
jgi:predicted nucleotidyltransferase